MDHDELVNRRVSAIARIHGCSVADVNAALDKHPLETDRDAFLKRTMALELIELDRLAQAFEDKALVDRDVQSGLLLLKVAERRATLLGMNAPIGHAVAVIQHVPEHKISTTEEISALIDEIRGIPHKPWVEADGEDNSGLS